MSYNNVNVNVSGPVQPTSTYKTKVLKGNHSFASQVTEPNMKYVIKHNFDLGGESVTIPGGCLLEFDGGAIYNGTLVGQNTILIYNQPLNDILTATLEGTWKHESSAKADEEDITDLNGELKFKDKAYAPANYSGLGKKILRKNIVNGVNTLTQEMINQANTIYVIQYDFTLSGNVTVPANCVLEFNGGSIENGTIIGQDTKIVGEFNVDKTEGSFWVTKPSIRPSDYNYYEDSPAEADLYIYIDTQKKFEDFLNFISAAGNAGKSAYGILAPKRFRWPLALSDSARELEVYANTELIGTHGAIIDGYEIEYNAIDAADVTSFHYKCKIKTNSVYTQERGIGLFPLFVDEDDNLVKVATLDNLQVPTNKVAECIQTDNGTKVQIPVPTNTGHLKNRTFSRAFGSFRKDYGTVYFQLTHSDSNYLYGNVIWDSLNYLPLNRDATTYQRPLLFSLYNMDINADSVYYDDSYIYIPKRLNSLKFVGSYCVLEDNQYVIHGTDTLIVNPRAGFTCRGLEFKNFPSRTLFTPQFAGDTTVSNYVTIEDCKFENIYGSILSAIQYVDLVDASTWKGAIINLRRCSAKNFEIMNYIGNGNAAIISSVLSYFISSAPNVNASTITVKDCKFTLMEKEHYYFTIKRILRVNTDAVIEGNTFVNSSPCSIDAVYGQVTIQNNNFMWTKDFCQQTIIPFICDAGVIYIGKIERLELTSSNNRYEDTRNKVNLINNLFEKFTTPYRYKTNTTPVYIDDGRGNVYVEGNYIMPFCGGMYSIFTHYVLDDEYSGNRIIIKKNVLYCEYLLKSSELCVGTLLAKGENNIVLNGIYPNDNGAASINDLPRPARYVMTESGICVDKAYVTEYVLPNGIDWFNTGDYNNFDIVIGSTKPKFPYKGEIFFDEQFYPKKMVWSDGNVWLDSEGKPESSIAVFKVNPNLAATSFNAASLKGRTLAWDGDVVITNYQETVTYESPLITPMEAPYNIAYKVSSGANGGYIYVYDKFNISVGSLYDLVSNDVYPIDESVYTLSFWWHGRTKINSHIGQDIQYLAKFKNMESVDGLYVDDIPAAGLLNYVGGFVNITAISINNTRGNIGDIVLLKSNKALTNLNVVGGAAASGDIKTLIDAQRTDSDNPRTSGSIRVWTQIGAGITYNGVSVDNTVHTYSWETADGDITVS